MKAGWEIKTLGEVCQIKPPKSEARNKISTDELVSFLPMESLGIDKKFVQATKEKPLFEVAGSYTYFADDDVLLAKITPCFENGKIGIVKELTNGIGFGSSEYIVFRPNKLLNNEWLYYYLSREVFRNEGAASMTGAVGHKRVAKEFIDSYQIPLPPLPEQKRLVTLLDEAFESIATAKANAQQNLKNARALFESHLNEVFTKRGEGWEEKTLGEVCKFENGDRGKNYPNREEYVESGMPWINTGHIEPNGTLSKTEMNFISKEKYDSLRGGKIQSGDLVYCLRGATLGKTALVTPYSVGAVASSLVIIRPYSLLNNRFLYRFLTSAVVREQIKSYENGAAQPNLGANSVAKFIIWMPNITEQQKIVEAIDELAEETQRLEALYSRKIAALDELKKALLHRAFSGEL